MKWMALTLMTLLAAGCAGPSSRDDSDAMRRAEAKRELERECRIAAMQRRADPRCPQPERGDSMGPERAPLPPPPDVRLPGS